MELLNILQDVSLVIERYKVVWHFARDGIFTVNSFYKFVNNGGVFPFSPHLWHSVATFKVRIFMWLALHDRILTIANLKKRKWNEPLNQSSALCG